MDELANTLREFADAIEQEKPLFDELIGAALDIARRTDWTDAAWATAVQRLRAILTTLGHDVQPVNPA